MNAPKEMVALAESLADVVAMQGKEDHLDFCKRIDQAERLLKRLAPDVLKSAKQRAAAIESD